VDDEKPARSELAYYIERYSTIKILKDFDDALEALDFVKRHKPDFVFLDINMPRLDGVSFARQLKSLALETRVVFVTAHREYAVEAFELEAYDYLLKPFSESRILSLLRKLIGTEARDISNFPEKLTLWKAEKMRVVPVSDLCYIEVREREVHLFTVDDAYVVVSSISNFQKKLDPKKFFRCHRSYIVNLDKIEEIIPWFNHTFQLKLKGLPDPIPVSRHFIPEFKQFMSNF
jgi:two-component system LytT family response regulator